jgi:hypothetical protein
VDGFAEFTENERRTLARVARFASRVEIALLLDPSHPTVRDVHHLPDALNLFHQTLRRTASFTSHSKPRASQWSNRS